MPRPDYDNTLVGKYIRAIENPDSAGYRYVPNLWYAPEKGGYDPNNRGMGVDIKYNTDAASMTEDRADRWLSVQEERGLRNKAIQDAYGYIKRYEEKIPSSKNMSPEMAAMAAGVIYRGDGPQLWDKDTELGKAYHSGNTKSFDKAVQKYYTQKGYNDRVRNHNTFWKTERAEAARQREEQKRTEERKKNSSDFMNNMWNRQQSLDSWGEGWKRKRGAGGSMTLPDWDGLALEEKSAYMDVALRNGVSDLPGIRKAYNEFAAGGKLLRDGGDVSGGGFPVDMTAVGLGAERKPGYYVDRTMFPLEEVTVTPSLLDRAKMEYMDEITASNDATVNAGSGRGQNTHLRDRAVRGAEAHAAWEKDNPEAAAAGYALGSVPFAVATAPAWMYAGDALAATSLGRGITAQLTSPYSYTSMGLMGTGVADAGSKIYNGQTGVSLVDDAMTAMELLPLGYGVAKAAGKAYGLGKSVLYSTPQYRNYRIAREIDANVSGGIAPTYSDNMMYRYTLPQEVDDLMMYGQYRDMPSGQTVRRAYNSEKEIAKRLAARQRVREGKRVMPLFKEDGNSHGGKAFAKGEPWRGTTSSGTSQSNEMIVETPGTEMRTGHHGSYSAPKAWEDIPHGEGLWRRFMENGDTGIPVDGSTVYYRKPDGTWGFRSLYDDSAHHMTWNPSTSATDDNVLVFKRKMEEAPFGSSLDWTPESWFAARPGGKYDEEDVKALASHVPEYMEIERKAKADGTWLKNADGTDWEGDPREWVMLQSENAKWLNPDYFYTGYRPSYDHPKFNPSFNGEQWGSSNPDIAKTYVHRTRGSLNKEYYPKDAKVITHNADHKSWRDISDLKGKPSTTNIVKDELMSAPHNADVVKIMDVHDPGPEQLILNPLNSFYGNDYILRERLPRKSILGNNGNLDRLNPNIYKAIMPFAISGMGFIDNK